jgi:hypothetical protein
MSGPLGFAADKAMFGDLNLLGDFERARTDHQKTEFERFTFAEEGSTLILALKDLHSSSETVARNTARTADATEAVNNKTLDPFGDTADSYLANTAMQMQSIMGSILGQTPQDQLEETNNILQAILGTSQSRGFNSSTPSLGLGR